MEETKKNEGLEEEIQNMPTKGEQCMLVMILTTLLLFLIFLIVFAIHLALVKHTVNDIFRAWNYDDDENKGCNGSEWGTYDQSSEYTIKENNEPIGWLDTSMPTNTSESEPLFGIKNAVIGIVYLNISSPRILCNALKIKDQWSLVPGYCSALWSDRHMTEYISAWLTRYYIGQDFIDLEVLRNVPHPHFNRNDFRNNIGLLEHYRPAKGTDKIGSRSLPNLNSRRHFKTEIMYISSIDGQPINIPHLIANSIKLSYDLNLTFVTGKLPLTMEVAQMSYEDCLSAIFAVASPRNYEICYEFAVKSDSCVDNGGFLQEDYRTIGLFSWMNRCPDMELPFVVLTLHSFSRWIADTTAISSTDLETSSG